MTTTTTPSDLGIYRSTAGLDHDTAALIDGLLLELASRGVDRLVALASLRRVLRGAR